MFELEKNKDGFIKGVVSENSIFKEGEDPSVQGILDYINSWEERENPAGNSIYKFPFVPVTDKDGNTVMAVVCETDPEGRQFVGDALTLDEKAILIATEYGAQYNILSGQDRHPHQRTIRSYLMETLDAHIKKGFEVESELFELMKRVNYYHKQMPEGSREFRELLQSGLLAEDKETFWAELEKGDDLSNSFKSAQQKRRNLDPKVFEEANGSELSIKDYIAQLDSARGKLRKTLGMEQLETNPNRTHLNEKMISQSAVERGVQPILAA